MTLPEDFISLMHSHLSPEQAEALFAGLEEEPVTSIRLNTRKLARLRAEGVDVDAPFAELLADATPVPWCPDAFYLPTRPNFTLDPLFHAGAYYVQEASSMYLAEMLRQFAPLDHPLCALDLCAAPGGKSTLLRSLLSDDSLLVSNEPMPKRAQILAENITKWGHPLSVVTRNYPADFAPFVNYFDLLVTDVPCSGEGMFRKDEGAIKDWSLENVETCWRRQRDILTDIWPTLRPGGLLIYSTCTFNRFEDEDNVEWIARTLGATVLAQRHFFPGRDQGEGFFIAALKKDNPDSLSPSPSLRERGDRNAPFIKKLHHALHVLFDGSEENKEFPAQTNKAGAKTCKEFHAQTNKKLSPPFGGSRRGASHSRLRPQPDLPPRRLPRVRPHARAGHRLPPPRSPSHRRPARPRPRHLPWLPPRLRQECRQPRQQPLSAGMAHPHHLHQLVMAAQLLVSQDETSFFYRGSFTQKVYMFDLFKKKVKDDTIKCHLLRF